MTSNADKIQEWRDKNPTEPTFLSALAVCFILGLGIGAGFYGALTGWGFGGYALMTICLILLIKYSALLSEPDDDELEPRWD
ncbi:hypothetical protein [Arcanobacterium phocae]|uniref:hypothetical protein n=1 Tax=Arcanobacterium phocae TaxID=131112 RepID=UPI001C0F318A|nr:hypothetical protein [Arcanobacterium phocae]